MNKQQLKTQITGTLSRYFSVTPEEADAQQMYSALAVCVRDVMAKKNSDFTRKAKEKGAKIVSLGKRILRTETAAITSVSMCMLHIEMNGENK